MRACLSLHLHPILWLLIHGHTEKLNPTSLDFSRFFCCSCLQLLLLTFYWALYQFKSFRDSIIRMGNSCQGIREHVDTWFKCEKFAVIVHAIEKKNRKKGITLWHWAVIECNTNNIVTAQVEISLAMFSLPLFTGLDFITTTTCWHIFLFWQAYDPPVYLLTTSSMIVLKVVRASARFYLGECIGM